jgi:hypothetical protein
MKVRADSVLISCLLDTVALLYFIRPALWNYFAERYDEIDKVFRADQTAHYLGVACLAIILVGLIVVWTGYVRRSRSAWFVMFIIVWFWAFPLFILGAFHAFLHGRIYTFFETLYDAMSGPGYVRYMVGLALAFSMMVIALVLPIRRFFATKKVEPPIRRFSAKLVGLSAIGVLLGMTALYAWLSVGILYEIPVGKQSLLFDMAPPPPPPSPCRCPDGS